ncbi:hypothetical protein CP336_18690 [Pseudomonas fluorescens]|nr:hypothetical protein CP336_18690 [Pseudomonas fluorescens]
MRNIQTREGFEFWDKLNALQRYAFLLSPSGKSVQKFEDQAMGNWIDVHEAQKVVDQAQDEINQFRAERDALQQRLNAADQRIDEQTKPQAEQLAHMPVERCYDVRAKMIIAFNEARKNGGDLDDALDAAYKSALRFSPIPLEPEKPDRSPEDYAIEHAEYMAKSADDVLSKFQAYGLALLAVDEGGDDGEGELFESIDSTRSDLQESLVDLRSMVYEFRKRSNRCTPQ